MRRQNFQHWLCTLHTGICYIVKGGIYKYTNTTTILLQLPFFDTPEYEQELTSKLRWPHKKARGKHTRARTALAGNSM